MAIKAREYGRREEQECGEGRQAAEGVTDIDGPPDVQPLCLSYSVSWWVDVHVVGRRRCSLFAITQYIYIISRLAPASSQVYLWYAAVVIIPCTAYRLPLLPLPTWSTAALYFSSLPGVRLNGHELSLRLAFGFRLQHATFLLGDHKLVSSFERVMLILVMSSEVSLPMNLVALRAV